MKIILSRKGFDSSSGGQASPILPDGTLLSLPIPDSNDKIKFADIKYNNKSYLNIIKELKPNANISKTCHLDPDIRKDIMHRDKNWKPLFGQQGNALKILNNNGVDIGDIFLFFGLFRKTVYEGKKLKYVGNKMHIIHSYLQIGQIHHDTNKFSKQFRWHPHANMEKYSNKNNCIYESSKYLSFDNKINGAGCFNFHSDLVLTVPDSKQITKWNLPEFFNNAVISSHMSNPKYGWQGDYFRAVERGQEFIIEHNNKINNWAINLIKKHS